MYAGAGILFPYLQDVGFTNNHQLQFHEEELPSHLRNNGLLQDGSSSLWHQSAHTSNLAMTPNISEYYLGGEGDLFNAPQLIIEEAPQFEHDPMTAAIPMISSGDDITSMKTVKVDDRSDISDYFLGGEVDLFKAPEPILEEPQLELDSMAAAISMMPASSDITNEEATAFADIASVDSEKLLDDFFCNCKGNLLANLATDPMQPAQSDAKTQPPSMEGDKITRKDNAIPEGSIPKSMSMECLVSEDWGMSGGTIRPNFLDFQQMSLGDAFKMRRAYSEGDIKTLSSGSLSLVNTSIVHHERLIGMDSHRIEERQEKLSRYRRKKSLRNFGRKIKYACRKALADSQPRVRGRFARTEECEVPRIPK